MALDCVYSLQSENIALRGEFVVHWVTYMNPDAAATKADRFERLAERRVTEVVKKMRLVGNLSNKRNYAYTDEHVRQILEALETEMRRVKAKFRQETSAQPEGFSFRK